MSKAIVKGRARPAVASTTFDMVLSRHQTKGLVSGYRDTFTSGIASVITAAHATKISQGRFLESLLFLGSRLLHLETARELNDYLKRPIYDRPPAIAIGRMVKGGRHFSVKKIRNRSECDIIFFSCFGISVIEVKMGANFDTIKSDGQCSSLDHLVKSMASSALALGYTKIDAFVCTFNAPPERKILKEATDRGIVVLTAEELSTMLEVNLADIRDCISAPAKENSEAFARAVLEACARDGLTDPALQAAVRAYQKASVRRAAVLPVPAAPTTRSGEALVLEAIHACARTKAKA